MATLDLLYPSRCCSCGAFGPILCVTCRADMPPALGPGHCPNCSARWDGPLNCPGCEHWRALSGGLAACEMAGPARSLVHAFKYSRIAAALPEMAAAMALLRDQRPLDVCYPVPLHPSRERSRGFNQAARLVEALGWPPGPGRLARVRKTKTQVGLPFHRRRANVSGAFAYDGPSLRGQRVAIVDDVVTTGVTAEECATVLKDAGAREVIVLSFARAAYRPGAPIRD